jgi:hypothetical protein
MKSQMADKLPELGNSSFFDKGSSSNPNLIEIIVEPYNIINW